MGSLRKLLEKCIAWLASAAMLGIVVVVFANVVLRYVFNTGLTWSDEVSVNLFVWFIFLGAILAAIEGLHLKVDVLTNTFSKTNQKICAFIANIFVLIAMGILSVGGYNIVKVTSHNVSSATGLPFSYITVSLVVFAVCMILLTLQDMVKDFKAGNSEEGVEKK